MTLDEAINFEILLAECNEILDYEPARWETQCHRQMAEWLRELKELRKLIPNRVHPSCAECIHMKEEFAKQPCRNCCNNYISRFEREVKADEREQ